jgi:hypothetical protein
MAISETELIASINKTIADFCSIGYTNARHNHCAHFVSHMLNLRYGTLCDLSREGRNLAAVSVRCNEIYNRLATRGALGSTQPSNGWLIFATSPNNFSGDNMGESPRKHVGIYFNGKVYNYGNAEDKVRDDTLTYFHDRLKLAYSDPNLGLYYAVVP